MDNLSVFVVDTETATMNGPVVDLAAIEINENLEVVRSYETLLKPHRPIVPAAQSVHGISNAQVADAPTLQEWVDGLGHNPFDVPGHLVIVAHNAQFDCRMLAAEELLPEQYTKCCTLRIARNLWPDLDEAEANHKLGTLAVLFSLEAGPAHRAMGDAVTCLNLLRYIANYARVGSFEELIALGTRTLSGDTRISFGKHKGTKLKDLPHSYVSWCLGQDGFDPDLIAALKALRQ